MKTNDVYPGSGVSVDHFVSKVPGRLYTSKGRSDVTEMYKGGCIFVDHASGLIYVKHQIGFGAIETIEIKQTFENWAYSHGVLISKYTTDNGTFGAKEFLADINNH